MMVTLHAIVKNEVGLHARPATLFVQCANRYKSRITVRKDATDSLAVNAKSILHVLTLGVVQGEGIELVIDGEDEIDAAKSLTHLIDADFAVS
jgi:phosphocarrier protein HPr